MSHFPQSKTSGRTSIRALRAQIKSQEDYIGVLQRDVADARAARDVAYADRAKTETNARDYIDRLQAEHAVRQGENVGLLDRLRHLEAREAGYRQALIDVVTVLMPRSAWQHVASHVTNHGFARVDLGTVTPDAAVKPR